MSANDHMTAEMKKHQQAEELYRQVMRDYSKQGHREMLREDFADMNGMSEDEVEELFDLIDEKVKAEHKI